jgi:hypothetical protein
MSRESPTSYLVSIVDEINQKLGALKSVADAPVWINPNNSVYIQTGYSVGDIVVLYTNELDALVSIKDYIKVVCDSYNLDYTALFLEKANPNIDHRLIRTFLYGGVLDEQTGLRINPITILSPTNKRSVYISLIDENFDTPGTTQSWFNLDDVDRKELGIFQKKKIARLLTQTDVFRDILGALLEDHIRDYHFNANDQSGNSRVNEAAVILSELAETLVNRNNLSTSTLRIPVFVNGELVGKTTVIKRSSGNTEVFSTIDTTNLTAGNYIKIDFCPNEESPFVVPTCINTNRGIINCSDGIDIANSKSAWAVDNYILAGRFLDGSNNLFSNSTYEYEKIALLNIFSGFSSTRYSVECTGIGSSQIRPSVEMDNSPLVECIDQDHVRTPTSITFKLNEKYPWKITGVNVRLFGLSNAT